METLLGFLIAVLVGLTGVGGGSLTVPILILGLNIPAAQAVGTALVFVTVTKLVAGPLYLARRQVDFKVLKLMLKGGIPGVLAGALLLGSARSRALEPVVLTVVGSVIAVMAVISLCKHLRKQNCQVCSNKAHRLPWVTLPIGLETGFSSAGAGALGSLALMCLTSLEASHIVGTDLLFGLALSAVGGGLHAVGGNVDPALLAKLCMGAIPGAALGAWLGAWLPSRQLRAALTVFLALLGGQLFWKGLSVLVR
ncbi:MAG: sulfite exporter TauE/SafE family protein [Acidobacteria bacterium]|nr:sulfite exporter TauE/SafE family protein [Acidobacteriota bacterium]